MGNTFKKKTNSDVELTTKKSIPMKGMSIFSSGTSIIPLSVSSLDEYMREEVASIVSTSSCTKPSVFDSEGSEDKSSDQKIEEVETVVLTAGQLENIYEQYKTMNPISSDEISMPEETVKVVRHLCDVWQTDMIYKFENYINYMTSDKCFLKKYEDSLKNPSECDVEQMFLRHSIKMILTYKIILDRMEIDRAEELIKQIAISHGLLGVAGADFKAMDLHWTRYLLQRNLINDESIIALVAFLSMTSEGISNVLVERRNRARKSIASKMELVGRKNITRGTKRILKNECMKQWAMTVPLINSRVDIIQKQIKIHQKSPKPDEDTATVDTGTLRARDFVMKKFIRRKKV